MRLELTALHGEEHRGYGLDHLILKREEHRLQADLVQDHASRCYAYPFSIYIYV